MNRVQEGHVFPRYLEGGKEAGGQLVDQRFCPRIVEGQHLGEMLGRQGLRYRHHFKKCEDIETTHGIRSFSLIHQKISKDIHINPYQSISIPSHQKMSIQISCQVSFAIISSVTPWSVSFTRNPRWATGESRRSGESRPKGHTYTVIWINIPCN